MRKIVHCLFALFMAGIAFSVQADPLVIVIKKQARTLEVQRNGRLFKSYRIALGFEPKGTKIRQGDGKTPEGTYYVRVKNVASRFYLSLGLSYPGPEDGERGLKAGLIDKRQYQAILQANRKGIRPPWNTKLGGEIFIHGGGSGHDWTLGCIALENADIEELFKMTAQGMRVDILP